MMAMVRTRPIYRSSDAQTSSKRLPGGRCRGCAWFILWWGCCSTFSCFFKSAKNNSLRRFRPKVAISVYRFPCCVLLALSWNTNLNEITEKLNIAIKSIVVQVFQERRSSPLWNIIVTLGHILIKSRITMMVKSQARSTLLLASSSSSCVLTTSAPAALTFLPCALLRELASSSSSPLL